MVGKHVLWLAALAVFGAAGTAFGEGRPPLTGADRALDRLEGRIGPGGGSYGARRQGLEGDLARERLAPTERTPAEEGEFRRRLRLLERRSDALPETADPDRIGPVAPGRTRILPFAIPETGLTLDDLDDPDDLDGGP